MLPNIHEVIRDHITLSVTCVDRLYVNGYLPALQIHAGGRRRRAVVDPRDINRGDGSVGQTHLTSTISACQPSTGIHPRAPGGTGCDDGGDQDRHTES